MLVDDEAASKYVYALARWAAGREDLEITHLIIHASRSLPWFGRLVRIVRTRGPYEVLGRILFTLITRAEGLLLRRLPIHRDHFNSFRLDGLIPNSIRIIPLVSRSGAVYRFAQADVDAVAALKLDLLIRCGHGILRGPILGSARLGIVSFHHGDNRVNRGSPAAFWETYQRWPKTGFVIQRLTEELDGGEVLLRGAVMTQYTYALNQAHLYSKANVHMKAFLARVAAFGALPPGEPFVPYSGPLYRTPRFDQGLTYIAKVAARLARRLGLRLIGLRPRWQISFAPANWREAVLWRSRSPRLPKGRFWADPFLIEEDGLTYCFVEDFVYKTQRGRITALRVGNPSVQELGVALEEPFHLSFPFLFRYDGALFMCPETHAALQIRIYRCVDFPLRWELAGVAMRDVSAADTMLFPHGGRWWMLTNIDESGTNEHSSELYAFYAETPLATNWTPHRNNPLIIDSERARNAGLIAEREEFYRLAQRQGFDRYGAGFSIHKIAELSPERYREELIGELTAQYRNGLLGTHHLSTTGKITVVDQLTRAFVR